MKLFDQLVLGTLPLVPRPIMRRLSARYIAGETTAEALTKMKALQSEGFAAILDILGEEVGSEAEARAAAKAYAADADAIRQSGLDAYVSVKPTHFGLRISSDLAFELYSELATHCASIGQFVRVEMEDHTTTTDTLALFARLREKFDNIGIVLQSRLFRTFDDIDQLPPAPVDVRLVKGIYLEPAEIAHTERQPIRDAFVEDARRLFERGHTVALATHDAELADRVLSDVEANGIERERAYFEVLLGVQKPLWASLDGPRLQGSGLRSVRSGVARLQHPPPSQEP